MSYSQNSQNSYSDFSYSDPTNASGASQAYFNPYNGQYYYTYDYQQAYPQQPVYGQQYPLYQYQDTQWVQEQAVPSHSYRQNRPRGRGGGGQNTRGRGTCYYNQNYYGQNQGYYNPNMHDQQYYEANSGPSLSDVNEQSNESAKQFDQGQSRTSEYNSSTTTGSSRDGNSSRPRYGSDRGGKRKQYNYSARGEHSGRGRTSEDRGKASPVPGSRPRSGDKNRREDGREGDEKVGQAGVRRGQGHRAEKDETQRGTLLNQLSRGKYECMVCYDNVRCEHAIWSCGNCFHVFHLHCIKKWARTSTVTERDGSVTGWRCPACQNVTEKVPNQYRCYCAKMRDPAYSQYETPHSCGEVCHKKRKGDCPHPCTLLCHPGPCPPCSATVNRSCDCGRSKNLVRCGHDTSYKCDAVCGKSLNCGKHECQEVCHKGDCHACEEKVTQKCYGGHSQRDVLCGSVESREVSFSCDEECRRALKCGTHTCEQLCHPGECGRCPLLPDLVTHCQCGQTLLTDLPDGQRSSCADPIPVCDKLCSKPLTCGPKDAPHTCDRPCHIGECGPCEGETTLMCYCGAKEKVFSCSETTKFTVTNPYKCERRCTKKKLCARHKCTETCCTRDVHICEVTCGKKLKCGRHKCKALCHRGNCQPCLVAGFDELSCHCGAEIIFPPIPCGTRPPECHKTCVRTHPCQHQVRHNCHSDSVCPPCTELMEKLCMGGHETRKNIPCHMADISCGRPCGRLLLCGIHKCLRICHKGDCEREGDVCVQPCVRKREGCDHPCAAPCHPDDACPKVPCKAEITIKCPCGHQSAKVSCLLGGDSSTNISEYQKVTVQQLSSGRVMDMAKLASVMKGGTRSLDCDAECAIIERNRRVALALEIKNPDFQGKLGNPTFSDFLKEFAKKYPKFVSDVEKALSDLVHSAKQSKHATRSHAFSPMTRDQRHLVHELAEFYGCETQSYDSEPKKNVVAIAKRDKCWLPNSTLTAVLQREHGRTAPPPIPHFHQSSELRQGSPASNVVKLETNSPSHTRRERTPPGPAIDYFDFSVS
ncbi:transcriptional repressor NF-X1-like [Haliotis rufescens]|uniref:transcriptional repressor NF-X1-like n=1 Tax=Haliotis rufescens TaxID=6454 RepID=UPI00201F04A8|nr:transcriptional repressor NF-X1-like [Haliotis rufescens]